MKRNYDIVVFGASGYTGRLVALHLMKTYGVKQKIRWAIAGRDEAKLQRVREEIGAPELPIVLADADDAASIETMAGQTELVLTTVGPYRRYGSAIVEACARAGTDYVDITGEPHWIHSMLVHEQAAKDSGARLVFCCGFDSVPFECGVFFLQQAAQRELGRAFPRVRGRVKLLYPGVKGGMSGGSLATLMDMMGAVGGSEAMQRTLADPFALTPGFAGPSQPDGSTYYDDPVAGSWVAPFMLATVNTKIVHRCNYLLGHAWGKDFRYDEMSLIDGPPPAGAAAQNPLDAVDLPRPGSGPSSEDRAGGRYELIFIGELPEGRTMRARVESDWDASADSTSRLVGESAMCMTTDVTGGAGGIWTAASLMGDALLARLSANAGLRFSIS